MTVIWVDQATVDLPNKLSYKWLAQQRAAPTPQKPRMTPPRTMVTHIGRPGNNENQLQVRRRGWEVLASQKTDLNGVTLANTRFMVK